MVVTSNNTFATFIPRKDGKYQIIAPTANILTDDQYEKIKDVDSFVDGVERGVYVIKGLKKIKEDTNQGDIFEDNIKPVELSTDDVIKSTLGETIIGIAPKDAVGIIKDVHVKAHLEEALKVEKRPKVRKALNAQIKTLDEAPKQKEENTDAAGFVD